MTYFCIPRIVSHNSSEYPSLTNHHKECITDLCSLLLNCVLSVLCCCSLLWQCLIRKKSVDKNYVLYFQEHKSRWILNIGLIIICACEFLQGVFTRLGLLNASNHLDVHVIVTPLVAEIAATLAITYYHEAESQNIPKRLLVLLLYWPLASFCKIAKLIILYESGFTVQHLTLQMTWALVIVYSLLAGVELTVLIQQKYLFEEKSVPLSSDVTGIKYFHNYVTLLSKATFYWLLPLLKLGYERPLEFEDLGKLPDEEKAGYQYEKFNDIYLEEKKKAEANGKTASLWKCYWRRFWPTLAVGGIIKIVGDMSGLIGPLSISVVISFVENYQKPTLEEEEKEPVATLAFLQNGYIMAFIVLLATFLQSTFSNNFNHLAVMEGLHLKSALQVLVYKKSLRMTSSSGLEVGAVVNHMSTDSLNMMMLFSMGHYIWAVPFKLVVLLVLLYLQLGYSALIGAATIYVLAPFQYRLCTKLSKIQKEALDVADERLRKTSELLQGIKLLKLYGWEIMYGQLISNVRDRELKLLHKDAIYVAVNTFITQASSILVTLVTFAIYSEIEGKSLSPAEVFTGLALFNQLTVPLYIIPFVIPIVINAVVSTSRLSKFLNLPEVESNVPWRENDKPSATVEFKPESGSVFLHLNEKDLERLNNPLVFDDSDGVFLPEVQNCISSEPQNVVTVQDGYFTCNNHPILTAINIQIPSGKLTAVVGHVGSGKSSLLSALIGELILMRGSVKWASSLSSVAYVPQKPWLLNATLKENVIFGQPYDIRRYHQVIQACALQADIDLLPGKDLTEIGERGVNLSGGQRQRIAVARAFYSQARTVILDDPLSSLDAHVANHIMEQGIKTMLIRRHRTVILVTNKVEFLSQTNKIIVLEAGRIKCQGSYSEIAESHKDIVLSWKQSLLANEKIRHKKPEERTFRERTKLVRMLSRQVLYRSGSTTEARPSFKRFVAFHRQMSHHDPSSPLPCHDFEVTENPWHFSVSSESSDKIMDRSNAVNSSDSLYSKSSGSSGVFLRHSWRKPPSRLNSRISAHTTADLIEEENEDEEETTAGKDRQDTVPLGSSATTLQLQSPFDKLVVTEERERGQISKATYVAYMKACSLPMALMVVFLIISTQTVKVATDFWLSEWTSASNVSENATYHVFETDSYLMGYAIFSVASIILSLVTNLLAQLASLNAVKVLHSRMLENIIYCPMKFFDTTPVGRIINRFSSDINVIDKKLPISLPVLLRFIFLCISAVIVDVIVTPYFLIVIIPILGIYYFLQHFFRYSSRELQRLDSITKSPIYSLFSETLSGLTTLRAFQEEKRFTDQLISHININNTAFTFANSANCWLGIALDYLGGIILFMATIGAMTAGILGHISPAFVGMAMAYTLLVPIYLNWVVRNVASVEMYMNAVERVENYSNLPVENYAGIDAQVLPKNWPMSGEIIFQNVTLKYDTVDDPVLKNITLKIKPGEKVAICGRTGSGKSSLVMALFRMLSITDGKIVIDDINITALPLEVLRSKLSIIPQDTVLFPGSIRENLDPGGNYSDDELWSALEISQLKDTVKLQKEGLDFEVADEGLNFSAGQRQLFCLARAILRKSKILVMDEATASLDSETDQILQRVVSKQWAESTVLTIAHRVSSILDYDRVVVLSNGNIAEIGNPKELAGQKNSIFASLVKASSQS